MTTAARPLVSVDPFVPKRKGKKEQRERETLPQPGYPSLSQKRIDEERNQIDTLKRAAYRVRVDAKAAQAREWAKQRTQEGTLQKQALEEALVFAELVAAGLTVESKALNEQKAKNVEEFAEQQRLEKQREEARKARIRKKAQEQAVADHLEHAVEEPLEAMRVMQAQEKSHEAFCAKEVSATEASIRLHLPPLTSIYLHLPLFTPVYPPFTGGG